MNKLKQALAITLPNLSLESENLEKAPAGMLSINETIILKQLASCYKKQEQYMKSLALLQFVKRCMEYEKADPVRDEDLYLLCMEELVSVLGDCGYYEESNQLGEKCLEVMLMRQTDTRMANCLFSMAWNMEQQRLEQPEKYTGKKQEEQRKRCLALLHMAYIAAMWLNNTVGQSYLKKYCEEVYGVELEF